MMFLNKLNPKKRKIIYIASIVSLVLIIAGIGFANKNKGVKEVAEQVIKKQVTTQTITKQNEVVTSLSASGTIVPKLYSQIRSLVQGTIEYITPVGTQVGVGTPLFKIRDSNIENNYFNALQSQQQTNIIADDRIAQAKLSLSGAEARYKLAQNNLDSTLEQANQTLKNIQNSAIVAYNTTYNTLNQFYVFINSGSTQEPNYIYREVVSNDTGIREAANFQVITSLGLFNALEKNIEVDNLDNNLSQINSALNGAKLLADQTVVLLQGTLGGIDDLAGNKTLVNSYQSQLNTHIGVILNSINALRSAVTSNALLIKQAQSQLELAQIELANTKIGLANTQNSTDLEKIISQTQLGNASYSYNNLSISSPFAGTILSVTTEPGQQVSVGQEIVELGNLSIVEIRVEVDAEFASSLLLRDKVMINQLYEGFISEIEPIGNLTSGKVGVKIQTKNDDNFLTAGDTAEVEFNLIYKEPGLIVIPIKAATIESSDTYVYVVVDNKVVKKSITLGKVFGNKVSVESGLNEGDELILRDGIFISEGEEVEIVK